MPDKYWMVYVEGKSAPTFKHPSLELARKEATRLLEAGIGNRAYVLETIECGEKGPVEWKVCGDVATDMPWWSINTSTSPVED